MMKPRLASIAAWCRELAMPASVLASIAAFGSAGMDNTRAAPIADRATPANTAETQAAKFADKLPPIQLAAADASFSMPETAAAHALPSSPEPEPIVTAALTDPSELLAPDMSEPGAVRPSLDSTEILDECLVVERCVDRYLWALYQRTPKEDAVKTEEQRKVTVKKKGRLVTVTRSFTKLVDEDFAWKDPKAAEKAGMPIADYVIGGMDREFKLKLFHMLNAAEQAGLSPGITSAFRDDYRQSIASGLKAATDRSYHGGSFRGGYGHGLAADLVSVNGATRAQRWTSTETFWKWIDAHGQEYGIGRPYLDRDPPHVAPVDGKEYADHRPGRNAKQAVSAAKPAHRLAARDDRGAAKRARTAKSSRAKTSRPA